MADTMSVNSTHAPKYVVELKQDDMENMGSKSMHTHDLCQCTLIILLPVSHLQKVSPQTCLSSDAGAVSPAGEFHKDPKRSDERVTKQKLTISMQ